MIRLRNWLFIDVVQFKGLLHTVTAIGGDRSVNLSGPIRKTCDEMMLTVYILNYWMPQLFTKWTFHILCKFLDNFCHSMGSDSFWPTVHTLTVSTQIRLLLRSSLICVDTVYFDWLAEYLE